MAHRSGEGEDDSETLSPRVVHNHYSQSKNGNGNGQSVNALVWAIAGFAVLCLVTITGIMWNKQIEMTAALARLEAQMVIVLNRLPP